MNGLLARAFLSSELLSVKSTVHKAHHPHVSVSSVADSDEVDKDRKLPRRSEGGGGAEPDRKHSANKFWWKAEGRGPWFVLAPFNEKSLGTEARSTMVALS